MADSEAGLGFLDELLAGCGLIVFDCLACPAYFLNEDGVHTCYLNFSDL